MQSYKLSEHCLQGDKSRPYLKELRNVQFPQTPLEETFFLDKGGDVQFGTIIMTWPTRTPTCDKWGGWYRALGTPIHWAMMSWKVSNGWSWYKKLELNVLAKNTKCIVLEAQRVKSMSNFNIVSFEKRSHEK